MGKKTVKSGTVLAYPIILLGLAVIAAAVGLHFGDIEFLKKNIGFLDGDGNKTLRFIVMGVGAVIGIVGFFKLPRASKSK